MITGYYTGERPTSQYKPVSQLRTLVNEKTSQRVRGLIQGVASGGFEKGSDAQIEVQRARSW